MGELPIADMFNVWTNGDTIAAGSDSTAFVSFDAGATWIATAKVAAGVTSIKAVRAHNGRLYAGTSGQGVFVSTDLGATWQGFNQGLVGGINNSQLFITNLLVLGDSLYAATDGAGPWVRNLATAGTWSRSGNEIVLAQAGNMTSIDASPTRLIACGGFNGDVFYRDPGQPDWTESLLLNDRLAAGLAPLSAVWTGSSWLVGTNIGVFRSALGQSPWTYFDFGLHPTLFASFALYGGVVFTHFANGSGTGIEYSIDHGVTWRVLDALPNTFVYNIATIGNVLYAGRVDGLWRRSIANVTGVPDSAPPSLSFAIAGPRPVGDRVRFTFELPEAGPIAIDVFDIAGRRVGEAVRETRPAGHGEIGWDAGRLGAGVYYARLTARGRHATARLVHLH